MSKKIKVAILSLTSCQGCQFAILDSGKQFLELSKYFDFIEIPLLKDVLKKRKNKLEIAFIEGSPSDQKEIIILKKLRKRSKILVGLGNCAVMGGIQTIRNFHQPLLLIKRVYKKWKNILKNFEIEQKRVIDFVNLDYIIPGCPINAKDFFQFLFDYLIGKKFKISNRPVCYECQINQYECLLEKGEICFGPFVLGGCEAICLKNKQPCLGCRGLLKDVDKKKIFQIFKNFNLEEILKKAEIFGLRKDIEIKE
jgi:coenzyme F420-reducing hydrogenase gamma subunit